MKKHTIHLLLVLILACTSISTGMGQSKKISIRSKNESLRHVLNEISQQSNVEFIFDDKLVNGKTVTCDVQSKTAHEALKEILNEFGLAFREVQDDRIILYEQQPQEKRFKLTGRVTDASTGQPLFFANVFLSNTTLGCATDKEGRYVIENIPPGTYDLVVTMMGYEFQKKTIQVSGQAEITVDFDLKPKVLEGEKISVTAEIPKEWKKNLKIFEILFLGSREFAKKCKIENPEVLDFLYDSEIGQFQAFSEEPFIFTNNALGYEMTLILNVFHVDIPRIVPSNMPMAVRTSRNDPRPPTIARVIPSYLNIEGQYYIKKSLQCEGLVKFTERVPENEKEKKNWDKNRLTAYNGSQRHFLRSLCEGRLKEEGFEIYGAKTVEIDGRTSFSERAEYKVDPDTLLMDAANPDARTLIFPEYLKVIYKKERSEFDRAYQKSWLNINDGNTVTLSTNGVVIPGRIKLVVHGYWFWDCADEWLPMDYESPQKK